MKKFVSCNPTKVNQHCDHITILFADGEENSTKGGDCWGMRSQHCLSLPIMDYVDVPSEFKNLFDKESNGYACAYIYEDYDETKRIVGEYRALLTEYVAKRDEVIGGLI